MSRKAWDYLVSIVVGVVLTGVSYGIGAYYGWNAGNTNWLEIFAVFTSYACTYLCVVERRWNYPIGAISSVAYAILFWQTHLYSSAILNLYLVPTLVYGWIRWRKDTNTRPISHVQIKWLPVYLGVTAVGLVHRSLAIEGGTRYAPMDRWSHPGRIHPGSVPARQQEDRELVRVVPGRCHCHLGILGHGTATRLDPVRAVPAECRIRLPSVEKEDEWDEPSY